VPELGKSNKIIKIKGYKFHIEKDIEMPLKPGGSGSEGAHEVINKTRGKSNRFSSHNYGGTFEIYCNIRLKSGNYNRNGIYFISEA
jgi:hypothetical protein